MIGEEVFKMSSGWEVGERCDDSEQKTFYIWSHDRAAVFYRPESVETQTRSTLRFAS